MSRHRQVRNLDIDEVLEEDEYEDDYDDENELDETQLSKEDRAQLDEGLSHILSVVGDDIPVTDLEIKEALWYYYFDREETINWLVEKISKIKAEEEKLKKKAAKKAAAKDRKPKYRRPPAMLYSDVTWKRQQHQQQTDNETKRVPTLAQLSQRQVRGSALQSLANRNNPAKISTTKPAASPLLGLAKKTEENKKPASALQSLAQQSTGQRKKSALQHLASRQQQTNENAAPRSSLAALAQSAKQQGPQRSSLAHLATRSNSRPAANKLSGLAGLGKKQPSAPTPPKAEPEKEVIEPVVEETLTEQLKPEQPERQKIVIPIPDNPLRAPPSSAATFLFSDPGKGVAGVDTADLPLASLPNSIGQAFYEAMKASASTINVFTFDRPSPDDVVLEAQSHRSGAARKA